MVNKKIKVGFFSFTCCEGHAFGELFAVRCSLVGALRLERKNGDYVWL